MTNFAAAPPLMTDADVLVRVEQLVGPAAADRRLWIMWVDGDGRQAPVVVPIDDIPRHPDPSQLAGLAEVLSGLRDELTTELGPCSVILTLERLGLDGVLPGDHTWAAALAEVCERAGTPLRGTFQATRGGVRRLR
ncbi:MAG: hypothetical protein M3Q39_02285 [Actinomycetota bacterium]|nr:hypothetical protein [Actinomycetota bacterium]